MVDTDKYFKLTIVTPFGNREEYNIRHLKAPGTDGDFGVLINHLPLITSLRIGAIELDTAEGSKYWATSGGYIEVLSDQVTILAETAEPADQIDLKRAESSLERALDRVKKAVSDTDNERNRLSLMRAINRIKVLSLR